MVPARALLVRASRPLVVLAVGVVVPLAAHAKPCDLDLQVALVNARQVFETHPAISLIDMASYGLFSTAFDAAGESGVYELAMAKLRAGLEVRGLVGTVRQLPASLSGRPYGWYYWDPAAPAVLQATMWTSDQLGDHWMLAIHLDSPEIAATQAGGVSPTTVGMGKLFGADIRGRVYWGLFAEMVPDLQSYGLQAAVNSGLQVRCRDVAQQY